MPRTEINPRLVSDWPLPPTEITAAPTGVAIPRLSSAAVQIRRGRLVVGKFVVVFRFLQGSVMSGFFILLVTCFLEVKEV